MDSREVRDLRRAIREVADEAYVAEYLPPPAGHDFPVQGRPYRSLDPEVRETLSSIAAERLRAFNWLCGFGPDWDNVPLDV